MLLTYQLQEPQQCLSSLMSWISTSKVGVSLHNVEVLGRLRRMCKMRDTFGLRVADEAVRQVREMSAEGKRRRASHGGRTGAR